ncbi:response regulator [Pseudactinotalea sp.]|uniref:response regulator n=1 Tax=Pseudactinotalea sp. TaxID=1926260 RepID=UPI003B3A28DD
MSATPPVRVVLVDDDPLVRAGLRLLLDGDPTIEVVGEASDGDEVSDAVAAADPDVVLMDVRMPRCDGVEATARVRAEHGERPAVVMLTTFDADATVLAALRAGAVGYLLKHAEPGELIDAARRAAAGESVFTASALAALVDHARATAEPGTTRTAPDPLAGLSRRERQIADAVARGLSNAAIAAELYLSAGTVKAEISTILAALGLENRIQLAVLAHQHREPDPPRH